MRKITEAGREGGRKGGRQGVRTSDVGLVDHHLLREEDLLGRDLHAQVPARHHDAVGIHQDLLVVVQAFLVLGREGRGREGRVRQDFKENFACLNPRGPP